MRGSWTAALLSGLTAVAAVALTACGVPPSGVIEAGAPASGMFAPGAAPPSTPATVSLFFLRDGDLTPYPRRTDDSGDVEAVVRLLFEGPAANGAASATTELPRLTDAPRVVIAGDGTLSVRLPGETAPLSRRAVLQLACTVGHAYPSVPTAVSRTDPEAEAKAEAEARAEAEAEAEARAEADAEADGDTARRSAEPGSLQVLGDGWTMTQSDHACPVVSSPRERPEAPAPQEPSG
ncbi:hypothetical protein ACH5A7_17625 [Streptomyces sp. NPDC018955]|uniref:hypothetical protein n=1 Tax=Streptomyces sp. NPDC018955 TaxID=3365055 RepID=UPI0037BC52D4